MSNRYIKGERFRVRSVGCPVPSLQIDHSSAGENDAAVTALMESERRRLEAMLEREKAGAK